MLLFIGVHQLLPSGVEGLVTVRATLTHAAVSTELEAQLVVNLAQAIQVGSHLAVCVIRGDSYCFIIYHCFSKLQAVVLGKTVRCAWISLLL